MAALKLARQLGLIETIYVDGNPSDSGSGTKQNNKNSISMQKFTHVVAVDFEATCWENQAPPKWRKSEIIEFPAVLVCLKTGKVEAQFHKYIKPIETPTLSAFCTQLTGIKQETVESGIPLPTALVMFNEWLQRELDARNLQLPKSSSGKRIANCAFVTWTDWDFGVCLEKECQRKKLKKIPVFNRWIDLRLIYRQWYNYRPLNFGDALTHIGLKFEGRPHSGIDDAKNLAALAHKMVCHGASLVITKDLAP